eukprot:6063855-Amphidinium_carterae.1
MQPAVPSAVAIAEVAVRRASQADATTQTDESIGSDFVVVDCDDADLCDHDDTVFVADLLR